MRSTTRCSAIHGSGERLKIQKSIDNQDLIAYINAMKTIKFALRVLFFNFIAWMSLVIARLIVDKSETCTCISYILICILFFTWLYILSHPDN